MRIYVLGGTVDGKTTLREALNDRHRNRPIGDSHLNEERMMVMMSKQ